MFCYYIEGSVDSRKDILKNLMKKSECLLDLLSTINYMDKVSPKISFIHGKGAWFIPESKSILMANKLESLKKPYKLQITKLLDLGDSLPIWKQAPENSGLASVIGHFFSNI